MQTVVHLVSGDESEQRTALAIAQNVLDDASGSIDDVAVVVQSAGIEAVTSASDHAETVTKLLNEGVPVRACSNTLEARGMSESNLVDDVEVVPEGAVEVTRLQNEDYAHVRP
jgi:intracellular sulfur oxidation DsrE/DsrF family protein